MSQAKKEQVETTPVSRACRRVLRIAAVWYTVWFAFFLNKAEFDTLEGWNKAYYLWRAVSDLVLVVALYLTHRKDRYLLVPLIPALIMRLCIEVATAITQTDANDPVMVFILWLTLTLGMIDQLVREITFGTWYRRF